MARSKNHQNFTTEALAEYRILALFSCDENSGAREDSNSTPSYPGSMLTLLAVDQDCFTIRFSILRLKFRRQRSPSSELGIVGNACDILAQTPLRLTGYYS